MPKKKTPSRSSLSSIPSKFSRVLAVPSAPSTHVVLPSGLGVVRSVGPVPDPIDYSSLVEMKRVLPSSPKVSGDLVATNSCCLPLDLVVVSGESADLTKVFSSSSTSVSVPLLSSVPVEAVVESAMLPESVAISSAASPVCESSSTGQVVSELGNCSSPRGLSLKLRVYTPTVISSEGTEGASSLEAVECCNSVSEIAPVCEISSTAPILVLPATPLVEVPQNPPTRSEVLHSGPVIPPNKLDMPWASKFKASLRNLKQMSPPTFLEDGTPMVVAPASVLLKAKELWKGHIVAQFHGLCPPPGKIYNDLNPIWGCYGNITVRLFSETAALIFIPSPNTRQWVVDVGFWQAGNCSCTVYPWSSEGPLALKELQTAPTWAILKNVPPQLYSLEGISVIASGIGEPLHTEKSRLDPINIGSTKVKVVINLGVPLPATIVVSDVQGNTAKVSVEYPRPPPKCLNCGRYGHLLGRCPKPLLKKLPFKKDQPSASKEVLHSVISLAVPHADATSISEPQLQELQSPPSQAKVKRRRSRSKKRAISLPPNSIRPPDVLMGLKDGTFGRLDPVTKPKWIVKGDVKGIQPVSCPVISPVVNSTSTKSFVSLPLIHSKLAVNLVSADQKGIPSTTVHDHPFPEPTGWDSMSKKEKKKCLKIWHNKVRSLQAKVFEDAPVEVAASTPLH